MPLPLQLCENCTKQSSVLPSAITAVIVFETIGSFSPRLQRVTYPLHFVMDFIFQCCMLKEKLHCATPALNSLYFVDYKDSLPSPSKCLHLSPGGHCSFFCTGVCSHTIGKLTHPQTEAGPSINKNRPIPRLCTTKHEPNLAELR